MTFVEKLYGFVSQVNNITIIILFQELWKQKKRSTKLRIKHIAPDCANKSFP